MVEEAVEVLDANSFENLIEELADVLEVIDAIKEQIGATDGTISDVKKNKKGKRGGFSEGYILLETRNPGVGESLEHSEQLFNELTAENIQHLEISSLPQTLLSKSVDRRIAGGEARIMMTVQAPLIASEWSAESSEFILSEGLGKFGIRSKITVKREGPNVRVELSVLPSQNQLNFDF